MRAADAARTRKRSAIRDASIPLFVRNGLRETTMSSIADAAGVSHGTVFLYFESKEALFRAAVLEPLVEIEHALAVTVDPERSAVEQLRAIVPEHVALIARREHYLRLLLYVQGQRDRFPSLARTLADFAGRTSAQLAQLVEHGQRHGELASGHAQLIALSYYAYLQGLAMTLRKAPRDPVWTAMAESALRLFGADRAAPARLVRYNRITTKRRARRPMRS